MQTFPYRVEDSDSNPKVKCIIPNYACKGHTIKKTIIPTL